MLLSSTVPFSPSSNTTHKLSSAVSVPAYTRSSHSAGGVAQALLDDDEDWEEDFQTPHTPIHLVVRQEEGEVNRPPSEWRPPGEVRHGGWLPEWTSARRSLRPWMRLTPTGGHSGGCKWPSKVLGMRRSHGMNCLLRLHQGLRVQLRPWPSILWLCGGGTSRCNGRACACLLPPSSTLASFLLMRRQKRYGRTTLVCGLLLCAAKGGRGGLQKKVGGEEGDPRD